MWRGRPTWAEIDLDAIQHNLRVLKDRLPERTELMPAVKANAYGHGAVAVARAALASGATRLAVAVADEGVELRLAGIDAPILLLGYSPAWEAEKAVRHRLTPTVTTKQLALAVASRSVQEGVVTPVHVKVDTGMGRFGLAPEELAPFCEFLQTLPGLELEGVFSHLATADEADKDFARQQFATFVEATRLVPPGVLRHIANSAAIIDMPELALDIARPGISTYGLYPSPDVDHSVGLRPALSLKSRVARLHRLEAGEGVSYGRTWIAPAPAVVALVPCGYGDGMRRALSSRGEVLVRGRRAPIRGRVCMDQFVIEVTHIPGVDIEDEVVIIGRQGSEEITADEVAGLAGTINYEICTGIAQRVPRLYLQGGQVVEVRGLVAEAVGAPVLAFPE